MTVKLGMIARAVAPPADVESLAKLIDGENCSMASNCARN
jgi:hypothetical protein